jgi:hypothetical protein
MKKTVLIVLSLISIPLAVISLLMHWTFRLVIKSLSLVSDVVDKAIMWIIRSQKEFLIGFFVQLIKKKARYGG